MLTLAGTSSEGSGSILIDRSAVGALAPKRHFIYNLFDDSWTNFAQEIYHQQDNPKNLTHIATKFVILKFDEFFKILFRRNLTYHPFNFE